MVTDIGAVCFGIVMGYVTYRTLVRTATSSLSDIAAVAAALGGGAITALYEPGGTGFAYYSIGLLVGMASFLVLRLIFERPGPDGAAAPQVLGDQGSARDAVLGKQNTGQSGSAVLGD